MKLNPICFPKQEFRFENEGERDFEKERTDEIPYTNLCCIILLCLMLLSLPVPLFCFLSVFAMCVYLLSFFVSLPSSFFSPFFLFSFFRAGLSLFIEKFQRNCSLIFSQLINSWSSLRQFFHNS